MIWDSGLGESPSQGTYDGRNTGEHDIGDDNRVRMSRDVLGAQGIARKVI